MHNVMQNDLVPCRTIVVTDYRDRVGNSLAAGQQCPGRTTVLQSTSNTTVVTWRGGGRAIISHMMRMNDSNSLVKRGRGGVSGVRTSDLRKHVSHLPVAVFQAHTKTMFLK